MLGAARNAAAALVVGLFATAAPAQQDAPPVPPVPAPVSEDQPQAFPGIPADEIINISADHQESVEPNVFLYTGYVDIHYRELRLQADRVRFNRETYGFEAEGNVVFDQPGLRLTGDRLEVNFRTGLGQLSQARGEGRNDVIFSGTRIEKIGADKYEVENGRFTSCRDPVPQWSFASSNALIRTDHYARLKNARLRVKDVPVLYLPWIMWPTNDERATGLLLPTVGHSSTKGWVSHGGFFWAISRSEDATFYIDRFGRRGWQPAGEFRYVRDEVSRGTLFGSYLKDDVTGDSISRFESTSAYRFPGGWVVRSDARFFNNINLLQEFGDTLSIAAQRTSYAGASVSKSFGSYYFNGEVRTSKTSFGSTEVRTNTLPSLRLTSSPARLLGSPLYFTLRSARVDGFDDQRPIGGGLRDTRWLRLDFNPEVSLPLFTRQAWFDLTPRASYRSTYYTQQVEPGSQLRVLDQSLHRDFFQFNLEAVGPVFSKVLAGKRFKHLIEPGITFNYIPDLPENDVNLRVDSIDNNILPVSEVVYGLTNRLLGKRKDPLADNPVAYELLKVTVKQHYSLDEELLTSFGNTQGRFGAAVTTRYSPVALLGSYTPVQTAQVDAELWYDYQNAALSKVALRGTARPNEHTFANLTWTRLVPVGVVTQRQDFYRLAGGGGLWGNRLNLSGALDYDRVLSRAQTGAFAVTYNGGCWSATVLYGKFNFRRENAWLFALDLKNVGSFGSSDSRQRYF